MPGGAADPCRGLPVTYIANRTEEGGAFWDEFHKTPPAEFRRVAAAKGRSLLAVSLGRSNCGEVTEQVRSAGACGRSAFPSWRSTATAGASSPTSSSSR